MIINGYAVVDLFLTVLRLGLGLGVIWLGWLAWRRWSQNRNITEDKKANEDRFYLLFLVSHLLLWLNIFSWPTLYLLLQSYVAEWPGVMCIYGVTQIGAGSLNASRFLPRLLLTLQVLKPALVFCCGAWFVLYLINRATRTAPLSGRVLLVLLASGCLTVADAAAEFSYLVIPKKEQFAPVGCCSVAFDVESRATRFLPGAFGEEMGGAGHYAAYFAVNLAMILILGGCGWLWRKRFRNAWMAPLVLVAAVSVFVNIVFLIEVASPRLLDLPFHHCPYDLVTAAPESLIAVFLFMAGAFTVGWGGVAVWLGSVPEAKPQLERTLCNLLRIGFFCYLGSLLMMSVELALA